MWFWLLLVVAAVTASELLLRLPWWAQLNVMRGSARKSFRILRSARISDHWKERVLPAYAGAMARASIWFFVLLCLVLFPVIALGLVFPDGLSAWTSALMRPWSIVALCAASLGWIGWRRKDRSAASATGAEDYSALDRVLHRLALGSPAIAGMTHDIERAVFLGRATEPQGGPVFVTGLARAGTTILMRELHATGQFGSLTYADMPFVLAPNLWARLSSRGRVAGEKRERAHGDGIEVDTQSPEALDEVYWRIFDGAAYIQPECLVPHVPDEDLIAGYRDLMRLVLLRSGKRRYLSKNNNMVLRLRTLAAAMPEARFLVPLRDPLQHAQSLLAQHIRFQASDSFTRDYMTWLGHHEFGATHLPMLLGPDVSDKQPAHPAQGPQTLDYWLRLWISVHLYLEDIAATAANVILVPQDRLARDPAVWRRLAAEMAVEAGDIQEIRPLTPRPVEGFDPALVSEARAIFHRLQTQAEQRLGLTAQVAGET